MTLKNPEILEFSPAALLGRHTIDHTKNYTTSVTLSIILYCYQ